MFEYYGNYINDGGTDWWNIAATVFGIVVSTIITIIIFTKTNRKERQNEKERLREIERYVVINLKMLFTPIDSSIESYNKLLDKISNEKISDLSFGSHEGLNSSSISWLNRADLFKIFITDKSGSEELRIRLFSKLYTKLDIINKAGEKMRESVLKEYAPSYNIYIREFNKHLNDLIVKIDQFRGKGKNGVKDEEAEKYIPFFAKIQTFYPAWQEIENKVLLSVAKEHLILKIIAATKKEVGNEYAHEMLRSAEQALLAINNVQTHTKALQRFVSDMIRELKFSSIAIRLFLKLAALPKRRSISERSLMRKKKYRNK